MPTIGRLTVCAFMLLGSTVLVGADVQSAVASCAIPQPLPQVLATAPVVFIGTVITTRNNARTATVHVAEIWRGKHIARTVVVRGSYVTGHQATSVDRFLQVGVRYLFVPEPMTQVSPFQDNNCTATQPYRAALRKYRPRHAHRP